MQRLSSSTDFGAATRSPKQEASSRLRIGLYQKKSRERFFTIDGVSNVSVTLDGGQMLVESDEHVPFDAIIEAVREAGNYTVVEA